MLVCLLAWLAFACLLGCLVVRSFVQSVGRSFARSVSRLKAQIVVYRIVYGAALLYCCWLCLLIYLFIYFSSSSFIFCLVRIVSFFLSFSCFPSFQWARAAHVCICLSSSLQLIRWVHEFYLNQTKWIITHQKQNKKKRKTNRKTILANRTNITTTASLRPLPSTQNTSHLNC